MLILLEKIKWACAVCMHVCVRYMTNCAFSNCLTEGYMGHGLGKDCTVWYPLTNATFQCEMNISLAASIRNRSNITAWFCFKGWRVHLWQSINLLLRMRAGTGKPGFWGVGSGDSTPPTLPSLISTGQRHQYSGNAGNYGTWGNHRIFSLILLFSSSCYIQEESLQLLPKLTHMTFTNTEAQNF